MALSASDEELDLTMTLGSRRSHARRAVARVLPSGLKRALHRMVDGGRALSVRGAAQKRTTGAPSVPVAAPLPPLDMTAHIPRDHARQVGSQY